jgi:very-short-patch-repair endonuclease
MYYTKEKIIELATAVHGDKYDYSLTEGVKNKSEQIIYKCKKHNYIHKQSLHNHLQGKGCPLCAKEKKRCARLFSKEEFIKKATLSHTDIENYDFDKIDFSFRDRLGRMEIYCKEHGRFLIRPSHFINGVGCQWCNGWKKDDEEFRERLQKIHPNLDFSETKYSERDKKGRVKVICPKHGVKYMKYTNLLNGEGCYECSMEEMGKKERLTNEEIIKRAKKIYGESTYSYEKLDTYNRNENNKVIITCPKHGDFEVNLSNFMAGKTGCPSCRHHKLELKIYSKLTQDGIIFEREKTFKWLKNPRTKYNLYLDFYLPEYNVAIECQGGQHFFPIKVFGGEETFQKNIERDRIKKDLCNKNGIKILYFMESRYKNNEKEDFSSVKKLIDEIKNKKHTC